MKKLFLLMALLFVFSKINAQTQTDNSTSQRILGTWYSDANRDIKWVFNNNGRVYNYNKDIMKVMYKYTISHSCQNNSDDNTDYLTLMDKDGDEYCFRLNAVNENKNGILSMTKMDTMSPLLFVNNLNVTIPK